MTRLLSAVAVSLSLAAALPAVIAAPQPTPTPGQMTPAHVWVQNRGRSEAVAVDLRDANLDRPLRVHIANFEASDPGGGVPLQTRAVRQTWEYDSLTVSAAELVPALQQRGAAGWEAVGVVGAAADGAVILLKRPR
jgi:hypothetical protein